MKKTILKIIIIAVCSIILAAGIIAVSDHSTRSVPDTAPTNIVTTEPPTDPPTEPPTEPPSVEELSEKKLALIFSAKPKKKASVKVEELYQYPELPAGCESVAVTIALNHFGCRLSKTEFADKYLIRGGDIIQTYVGDPYVFGGAGIFPPGLVKSTQNYIEENHAQLYAFDTTDREMSDLYKLLDHDIPVVVWTTMYMNYPGPLAHQTTYDGKTYHFYDNEHCVTLYGYNLSADEVYLSDPLRGKVTVSASQFESLYDRTDRCSMAIMDTSGLMKEYEKGALDPTQPPTVSLTASAADKATSAPTQKEEKKQ